MKRFTLLDGVKLGTRTGIWDNQKENNERIGDELWVGEVISMLNEGVAVADENKRLKEQIRKLEQLLNLISEAWSFTKEESVKEILRHEIKGIDTVTHESANAWNEYCILSTFFNEKYGEHWDKE